MSAKITIKSTPAVGVGGLISIIVGLLMVVGGAVAWGMVSQQLANERIYVSDDAPFLAGRLVSDPFSAYAQADAINKHALEASGGKTYAELAQDDPTRATVMNAAFLRSSLFTSVVSFGVAFLAFGTGIMFVIIGWALRRSAGGPPITIETDNAGPVVVENQKGQPINGTGNLRGADEAEEVSVIPVVHTQAEPELVSVDRAVQNRVALNAADESAVDVDGTETSRVIFDPVGAAPAAFDGARRDAARVNEPTGNESADPVSSGEPVAPMQASRDQVAPLASSSASQADAGVTPVRDGAIPRAASSEQNATSARSTASVVPSTRPVTTTFPQVSDNSANTSQTSANLADSDSRDAQKPAISLETGPLPVVPSFDELIAPENSTSISRVSRSERLIGENRRKVEDERARTGMTGTIPIVGETRRSRSQASAASPSETNGYSAASAKSAPDASANVPSGTVSVGTESAVPAPATADNDSSAQATQGQVNEQQVAQQKADEPRPVTGAISWQSPEDRLK